MSVSPDEQGVPDVGTPSGAQGLDTNQGNVLEHLYGGMDEPEMKIIDVFICKLRKKLANASGGKDYIETVWGRGYVRRETQK
jgi:two-component system cell cycle response regulator CtrA